VTNIALFVTMTTCFNVLLVLFSLFISIVDALFHTLMFFQLSFDTCENYPILLWTCSGHQLLLLWCPHWQHSNICFSLCIWWFTNSRIVFSYDIMSSALWMPISERNLKSFLPVGLCVVVSLFYETVLAVCISSAFTQLGRVQWLEWCILLSESTEPLYVQPLGHEGIL
jgi:olfactory receptor